MKIELENVLPDQIEKRSFEIITQELGNREIDSILAPIIKRVIHTTADFDYVDNLYFTEGVVTSARESIKRGVSIVTDTQMVHSGINKKILGQHGGNAYCYMSDEDVAQSAKESGTTRAVASIEKSLQLTGPVIYAIGNAPTALIRLYELILEGKIHPELIIAVPVGFVNVVEAKELIIKSGVPAIVARGRKGGSNVAAAICNALLYGIK